MIRGVATEREPEAVLPGAFAVARALIAARFREQRHDFVQERRWRLRGPNGGLGSEQCDDRERKAKHEERPGGSDTISVNHAAIRDNRKGLHGNLRDRRLRDPSVGPDVAGCHK